MKRKNNSNDDEENKHHKTEEEPFLKNLINYLVMNAVIKQNFFHVSDIIRNSNKLPGCFDVNFCNKAGNSLLHISIEIYSKTKTNVAKDIIQKLLYSGADENLKNSQGKTAHELLAELFPNKAFSDQDEEDESTEPVSEENVHIVKLIGVEDNDQESSSSESDD